MKFTVPGHPQSGFLWAEKVVRILLRNGWTNKESWCGVFVHADGSVHILYVDVFRLVWQRLKEQTKPLEFSEVAAPILRYRRGLNLMRTDKRARRPIIIAIECFIGCGWGAPASIKAHQLLDLRPHHERSWSQKRP